MTDKKIWIWRNGDHFWVFNSEYPIGVDHADPLTLGEPVGWGWLKPCRDGMSRRAPPQEPQG